MTSPPATSERRITPAHDAAVVIGLNAAIIAVWDETPHVLAVRYEGALGLPFGPFEPLRHRTMEIGLRRWVEEQTGLKVGYVEQLYTFGDRGRHATPDGEEPHVVSIGYLALTRPADLSPHAAAEWHSLYRHFPWEDHRGERPPVIDEIIHPLLRAWAQSADERGLKTRRQDRANLCFGLEGREWNEDQVLERYELLYEAGLVCEARRDRPEQHKGLTKALVAHGAPRDGLGEPMVHDHRRILATAMGRLRAKLKYRPVVFELMPETFTLFELQQAVEAVSGVLLHKQNFRRLLTQTGLVEPTGALSTKTGGRPAELYRFRREILRERPAPGVRMSATRGR